MSASASDKITDTRNSARPNSAPATGTRVVGGTTLVCDNLTGWSTASKVHFVTYKIDSSSKPVANTQQDCSGIVSGSTITSFTVIDGIDSGNAVGDVVEMLPTAAWAQDLADGLTQEHNRNGTHKAINATSVSATSVNTTSLTVGGVNVASILYPVGSIYMETTGVNPATTFGFGTWAAYGAGKVPIGVDTNDSDFNAANKTGGEKTHILTSTEMPAHNHTVNDPTHVHGANQLVSVGGGGVDWTNGGSYHGNANLNWYVGQTTAAAATGIWLSNTGSDGAHNNLPPYITCYMWRRTA